MAALMNDGAKPSSQATSKTSLRSGHAVHNDLSEVSTSKASAMSSSLMLMGSSGFATPKRYGGAADGPSLVVFSGGTAFNGVAGK